LSEKSPFLFPLYINGIHVHREASAELFAKPPPRQLLGSPGAFALNQLYLIALHLSFVLLIDVLSVI